MTENTEQIDDLSSNAPQEEGQTKVVAEIQMKPEEQSKPSTSKIAALAKAVIYWPYRFVCDLGGVILTIAFVWLCAVNMLIAQRVADVSFLKGDAARWFSSAFDGQSADVKKMTLVWESANNTIVFRATDISVKTKSGDPLNALSYVETELALRDVARGKIDPIRVVVDGGELSFLRDIEGNFIAGLGTPETVGEFGPVWRGVKNDGDNDLEIGRIKSLNIDNAKIYIRDEGTNYAAQLSESRLDVDFVPDAIVFDMAANLYLGESTAITSASPLGFQGRVSPDLQIVDASFTGEQLNPAKMLPRLPILRPILGLDAPLDVEVQTVANRSVGLQKLDVKMKAGAGTLISRNTKNSFQSASIVGTYNPLSETLDISELAVRSDLMSTRGSAALSNLANPAQGLFSKDTSFELALQDLHWNGDSLNIKPVNISALNLNGRVEQAENKIVFDKLIANFGSFQPNLKGALTRDKTGKLTALSLSGKIDGTVNQEQLLDIWPKQRLIGARNWIERAIVKSTLSNIDFRFDADEAVLSGQPLKNEDLTLTFNLRDGEVKYISTMTPATQVIGKGQVLGNQTFFFLESGKVSDVNLQTGKVSIPRIYPYGGDLIIEGEAQGPVNALISLLDQKPFEYVTPYGVNPSDFSGSGAIKLSVTRPLRQKISYEQVDFDISGTLTDVAAPFGIGKNKISKGTVILLANRDGLSVKGPVNIGPWQADLAWREVFDNGATPTNYKINGRLSQSDLDSFGVGLREFIGGGDVALSIDAQADGIEISRANISADLSETDMRIGPYWDKPRGVDAQMTGVLSFNKDQQLNLQNFSVIAPGLDLQGALNIGADLKLQDLNFSRAKITGFIDGTAQVKPGPNKDRFDIFVTGDYLDVSPFVDGALMGSGANGIDVPVLLTGAIGQLVLNQAYSLSDTNLLFAHNGIGVTEARLKGKTGNKPININLSTDAENNLRTLDIDIPDASAAAFAFFDVQSLKGGHMVLGADLPAVGTKGALTGSAKIKDLKVVQAPMLTTMLSLASLQGLADVLGGGGLNFGTIQLPFSYNAGNLSLREARASGPGLGMTGNGEIDFGKGQLDVDGVLVPAYTANSMLGSIPLIGDIFVGKKGEGIFALNYTITGPFEGAQVAVNPLSALTPGFLRGIFAKQRDDLPEQLREQIESVRPKDVAQE